MTTAADAPQGAALGRLLPLLRGVRRKGERFTAKCPAHDDHEPSLSVSQGTSGVMVKCFAGCQVEAIVSILGLTMADLFDEPMRKSPELVAPPRIVRTTNYRIGDFTHVRKDYSDGTKRVFWTPKLRERGLAPADLPLYGAEALQGAPIHAPVVLTEGEKARDALHERGILAVGTVTGADAIPGDDALRLLIGRPVLLWADNDAPGRQHMHRVGARLAELGHQDVRLVHWADAPPKGDAADFGGTGDELRALLAAAVAYEADDEPSEPEGDEGFERDVEREARLLRVRAEARRKFNAERRANVQPPEMVSLAELVARPWPPRHDRIEGWFPERSRIALEAAMKVGKTTLVGNLIRSLVDGRRFLGSADVRPVTGTVALLNVEVDERMAVHWLSDMGIQNQDRVLHVAMRGRASTFDIRDEDVRSEWAQRFRDANVEVLVTDCLSPIIAALGINANNEMADFLTPFDELLTASGIEDAVLVHHMGHQHERGRGDSYFEGWPDAIWRLVKESSEDSSSRFISAFGRDVDIAETRLHFDATTRHLTLAEGNRRDAAAIAALDSIEEVLREAGEPMTGRAIERALEDTGHSREAIRRALKIAPAAGRLSTEPGPRRSTLYQCASAPQFATSAPAQSSECASALIESAQRTHDPNSAVRGALLVLQDEVRSLAEHFGWPSIEYAPGHSVTAGSEAWSLFIDRSPVDRLQAAREALNS